MVTLDEEYAEAAICQELRFLFIFKNVSLCIDNGQWVEQGVLKQILINHYTDLLTSWSVPRPVTIQQADA